MTDASSAARDRRAGGARSSDQRVKAKRAAVARTQRVLIATDGSPSAQAALTAAAKFPWGTSARVRALVARDLLLPARSAQAAAALKASTDAAAEDARRRLVRRWKEAEVVVVDKPPADAIIAEARKFRATAIVLGWRGHGRFARMLTGSVSRAIAARAERPVLIVRTAPSAVRRFLVGFDASPNAEDAVAFLCELAPGSGSRATVITAVQPPPIPASLSRVPDSARRHIRAEARSLEEERDRQATTAVESAVARLTRCGWQAEGEVRRGAPLDVLLAAAKEHRADVLVLGARGVSGIERVLLGSVANGALDRAPIPVLLVQ